MHDGTRLSVQFAGKLISTIRCERRRALLLGGHTFNLAVGRRGRGVDNWQAAELARRIQYVDQSAEIHPVRTGPILVAASNRSDGSKMKAAADARECAANEGLVANISSNDFASRINVFDPSGRKIVNDANPAAGAEQGIGQMRAYKACPTRDGKNPQVAPYKRLSPVRQKYPKIVNTKLPGVPISVALIVVQLSFSQDALLHLHHEQPRHACPTRCSGSIPTDRSAVVCD